MGSEVPNGWSSTTLKNLGSTYSGLSGKTKADFGEGTPFVTYKQVFADGVIDLAGCDLVSVQPDERQHRVRSRDVLFTTSSETPKEIAYSSVVLGDVPELYLNSFCFGYRPNSPDELWPEFSAYLFRGPDFRREAVRLGQGSTRFNISKTRLMDVVLPIPPLPEQKKIAAILSSVDEAIQTTQAVIEQTRRVKEGLLEGLLTKGISHTRFKQTEIGEIPEGWEVRKIGQLTTPIYPAIHMESKQLYRPVIIRRRHRGVECPAAKLGDSIKVKNQFRATPGMFTISKRQIVHGACGLVPDDFPENAIVSKEYLQLRSLPALDSRFLDYFARTWDFQSIIEGCTYGVDREKYVLNEKWFFDSYIPLPPIEEQRRIVAILWAVEGSSVRSIVRLEHLHAVKAGLLQDLITGKVRVAA